MCEDAKICLWYCDCMKEIDLLSLQIGILVLHLSVIYRDLAWTPFMLHAHCCWSLSFSHMGLDFR